MALACHKKGIEFSYVIDIQNFIANSLVGGAGHSERGSCFKIKHIWSGMPDSLKSMASVFNITQTTTIMRAYRYRLLPND